jgi:hypothetical protein
MVFSGFIEWCFGYHAFNFTQKAVITLICTAVYIAGVMGL